MLVGQKKIWILLKQKLHSSNLNLFHNTSAFKKHLFEWVLFNFYKYTDQL